MTTAVRRFRRVVAALIAVGAGLAGAHGARALWADSAPISNEQVRSGRLDLTAGLAGSVSVPVTITPQLYASTTSRVPMTIGNAGNVPLDYRLDDVAWSGTPGPGTTALTATLAPAASTAACSAGTIGQLFALTTGGNNLTTDSASTTWRSLAAAASETLCLSLQVPAATAAGFQTGSPTITLVFLGSSQ